MTTSTSVPSNKACCDLRVRDPLLTSPTSSTHPRHRSRPPTSSSSTGRTSPTSSSRFMTRPTDQLHGAGFSGVVSGRTCQGMVTLGSRLPNIFFLGGGAANKHSESINKARSEARHVRPGRGTVVVGKAWSSGARYARPSKIPCAPRLRAPNARILLGSPASEPPFGGFHPPHTPQTPQLKKNWRRRSSTQLSVRR